MKILLVEFSDKYNVLFIELYSTENIPKGENVGEVKKVSIFVLQLKI